MRDIRQMHYLYVCMYAICMYSALDLVVDTFLRNCDLFLCKLCFKMSSVTYLVTFCNI